MLKAEKFKVVFKKTALKQLREVPSGVQSKILKNIEDLLSVSPHIADGKHIKKLTEGYRLRVGSFRIFYFVELKLVTITSIIRRTSTTY
ncbi:MAG: type II toxin-antitoxin system RelE/ParE family toxin [Patescibacteria group bacterium]